MVTHLIPAQWGGSYTFCKEVSALGIFSDPFVYVSSKHLLSSCTADAIAGIGARVED